MNRIRRIAAMLTGPAVAVLAFSAAAPPPVLAARVPPAAGDALHAARGPLQQCPSAVAAQQRVGTAWEHRRKFGGVGPAVGGWCLLAVEGG